MISSFPNRFKATYQGDDVWFILVDSHRDGVPPHAIVYTLAEAQTLANRSHWTRLIVHEAKKLTNARVIPQPTLL